ncbi:MAG: TIGR01440 family protein [Sporolactobacillus sp.]
MEINEQDWQAQLDQALTDLQQAMAFNDNKLLVIGCSTSEVNGGKIGTAGSADVAAVLFRTFESWHERTGIHFAFQCCEHLNRALILDRKQADKRGYDQVTVRPIRHAGGAMATYAFEHMDDPIVVEAIQADGGIDIGDTLIGMHLKTVAVPVRSIVPRIGKANLVMARTRPKLIGGVRAVYPQEDCR